MHLFRNLYVQYNRYRIWRIAQNLIMCYDNLKP